MAARAAKACSTGATRSDFGRQLITMWNPLRNAPALRRITDRSGIAALPKSAKASHSVTAAPNPTIDLFGVAGSAKLTQSLD